MIILQASPIFWEAFIIHKFSFRISVNLLILSAVIISQFYPMRILYIILGSIAIGLGVIGIFLPLLPTTPFLLLAAALYFKGSPRLYGWLICHRYLGVYIQNYRENKAITLKTKIVSITLMWIMMLICIFIIVDPLWVKIVLGIILIIVTYHLASFRTLGSGEVVTLVPIRKQKDIATVSDMAYGIWREHYGRLISSGQVEQMLGELQSPQAISNQIEDEGYKYYFLKTDKEIIGYIALKHIQGQLFLSKMYILKEYRGRGYSQKVFRHLENYCRRERLDSIWLNVNRDNEGSVKAYRKGGFVVIREEVTPIGNGYVMDDYIMEKKVEVR